MTSAVERRYPTQARNSRGLNGERPRHSLQRKAATSFCCAHPSLARCIGWQTSLTLNFVIPSGAEGPAVSTMLREKMLPNVTRKRKWLAYAAIALAVIGGILYIRQRAPHHRPPTAHPTGRRSGTPRIPHPLPAPGLPGSTVTQDTSKLRPTLRLLESTTRRPIIRRPCCNPQSTPGHTQLHLLWRHRLLSIPVTFVFDPSDTYADGTPDFLRLHTAQDRQAFRNLVHRDRRAPGRPTRPTTRRDRRLRRPAPLRLSRSPPRPRRNLAERPRPPSLSSAPSIRQYAYPQTPWAPTSSASAPVLSYPQTSTTAASPSSPTRKP